MARTLASSQSPSDTTLKQWTNVNIVHISSMNSILRENCFSKHFKSTYKLNLVTMIGGVYVTQTMRDGIAQVTKRQVFWRWSQLCHCLCWFHHLFLFLKWERSRKQFLKDKHFHFRTFCHHVRCIKHRICIWIPYLWGLFAWRSAAYPAMRAVMCNKYLFSSQRFRGHILALERQTLTFKRPEVLRGCHLWPPNGIHSLLVLCVKHFCWHFAMRRWWLNLAAECVL